jgi:hypothetical protein
VKRLKLLVIQKWRGLIWSLALPTGARESSKYNGLQGGLGQKPPIESQYVPATLPKPTSGRDHLYPVAKANKLTEQVSLLRGGGRWQASGCRTGCSIIPNAKAQLEDHREIKLDVRELIRKHVFDQPGIAPQPALSLVAHDAAEVFLSRSVARHGSHTGRAARVAAARCQGRWRRLHLRKSGTVSKNKLAIEHRKRMSRDAE